jgi:hypothetical protein
MVGRTAEEAGWLGAPSTHVGGKDVTGTHLEPALRVADAADAERPQKEMETMHQQVSNKASLRNTQKRDEHCYALP